MKTKNIQKRNNKVILICLSLLLVTAVVLIGLLEITGKTHLFSNSANTATTQQDKDKKAATVEDKSIPTTSAQQSSSSSKDNSSSGTYQAPSSSDAITISASKTDSENVTITTKLKGYSDGSCRLLVNNGSSSLTMDAQVIYQSDYSICAGFTVPVSKLGTGTWNIQLQVTSGGITQTKSLRYEVI